MKILAIGDPHGDLKTIKKINLKGVDLVLLTGDLGSANLMRKIAFENIEREKKGLPKVDYTSRQRKMAFMEAYNSSIKIVKYLAKKAPVFTIYGNVENSNAETRRKSRELGLPLPFLTDSLKKIRNAKVINNKKINVKGIAIAGLEYFIDINWVKDFKPRDYEWFMREAKKGTLKARDHLRRFGKVDVLVCHQPPYRLLDKVTAKFAPKHWQAKHAGSEVIAGFIKRYSPRYVFCGHIHEGEGYKKVGITQVYNLDKASCARTLCCFSSE